MPDEPEALGLLALVLLHDARRAARVDQAGDLVPLDTQDRTQWDGELIAEALDLLDAALRRSRPGPYQVRAAARIVPSPVVELNRAVAVAMADGPEAGLALLGAVERSGALDGYHLLPATRADLLRRLGRFEEAAVAYPAALALPASDAERRYLFRRLTEVTC